jgi:hypothetical protein
VEGDEDEDEGDEHEDDGPWGRRRARSELLVEG